jgi:GTP cyclohydrolase I
MQKDYQLGLKVRDALLARGIETPILPTHLSRVQQTEAVEEHFRAIMQALGLDLSDDSLFDTPRRVAKMYVSEIFTGLNYENFPKCTTVENKMSYDELVVVSDINVQSNCEHHFVVIDGKAVVAYLPDKKVLGLSKINRVVEFFSKRPQIQERLTEQIHCALSSILETESVAVFIQASHFCVKSRGVRDVTSYTSTSKLGGRFKEAALRAEFMGIVNAKT